MQRVQRGEVPALDALFERYRPRLFAFLARRCGDAAAAEDLLQETWLRLVRSRARYDPRRRFSTWLFQIANNLCRDRARRAAAEARRGEAVQVLSRLASAARPESGADQALELRRRLERLPDRLREVLVLRYYHGLQEAEIAAIAGIARGTVKSRLHQALRALREQERDPGSDDAGS
jgi:RNA polymerase sigma-70 factor (ECF subfamily)